ncbi:MAG: hypothetical protein EOO01_12670 [Chitinophagaceae bacterium]|nr:MAG: hypothetical protein EOO01_12670 [Chitinophagaceae bacterium]
MTRLYKTGETVRVEGYQADLRRWFTAQYSRVGEPGSRLFAVVFNDVTKRKQHEQQQEYLMKLSDMLRSEQLVHRSQNLAHWPSRARSTRHKS